jgi:hypothetical protein
MLISEMIAELEQLKKDNGDLDCLIFNSEDMAANGELNLEPVFMFPELDEEDKITSLLFVDFETFAAFNDTSDSIN